VDGQYGAGILSFNLTYVHRKVEYEFASDGPRLATQRDCRHMEVKYIGRISTSSEALTKD